MVTFSCGIIFTVGLDPYHSLLETGATGTAAVSVLDSLFQIALFSLGSVVDTADVHMPLLVSGVVHVLTLEGVSGTTTDSATGTFH
jgi:hypothetical protein